MIVPLDPAICEVTIARSALCVKFVDGRTVCAPLEWFPLLSVAKPVLRDQFRIADDGMSVSWPALGETISVEFLLARRETARLT